MKVKSGKITSPIELFELGMDRAIPKLTTPPISGKEFNLGCGSKLIRGTCGLQLPHWDGNCDPIPCEDGEASVIHAYHFLEHLNDPPAMLRECQRALMVGGVMYIVVPYYSSKLQAQDIDHKSSFCEKTWDTLFSNQYYDNGLQDWKFKIGFNMILGLLEHQLCLATQLVREE